jgi:hypothetical protein
MRLSQAAFVAIVVTAFVGNAPAAPNAQADVEESIDQRLFPDGRRFDFGTVPAGRLVQHSFRIVNRYHVPLQVLSVRVG